MKKTSLLMILAAFAVQFSSSWASDTSTTGILADLDEIKGRVSALEASNKAAAEELERAKLMEQLRAEEAKAADLAQQKKQQEETANLPKTWEGIPWTIMHTAWVNNYSAIENAYDPRKNGTSASKSIAKFKKKNLGEEHRPAVSQINSSHTHVLKSHPNTWAGLGVNEGTDKHLQIGRFLISLIWNQAYGGKVGFSL